MLLAQSAKSRGQRPRAGNADLPIGNLNKSEEANLEIGDPAGIPLR